MSIVGADIPARRVLQVAPVEALRPEASYEWEHDRRAGFGALWLWPVGLSVVGGALALFIASILWPGQRWIPTLGIVTGMSGVTMLLPAIVPRVVAIARPTIVGSLKTVGRLATDALEKNPGRTTFTVAALILTLGVAIGVGSALASYEAQVERSASALIGAPLYVTSDSFTGLTSDQPLPASLRSRIEKIDGVRYVYPLRFAFVDLDGEQGVLYAVSVDEAIEQGASTDLEEAGFTADPEGFVQGLRDGGVAISRLTADRRGLEVGDELPLPTPEGRRPFEVVAVYNDLLGFESLYLDYSTYVAAYGDDKADEFGVLLEEGVSVAAIDQRLERMIDKSGVGAHVDTEDELLAFIQDTVEGTFALGQGIQLAALVVALLTIANTMFTAVYERRWEMGLQRAVGMTDGQLARSVLLEAGIIGAVGGAGGAVLGTASGFLMIRSMEAQYSWSVPFAIPWVLIVLAVGGGIAVAAAAGAVPSRMAVRSSIVDSLRYE